MFQSHLPSGYHKNLTSSTVLISPHNESIGN